MDSHFILGVVVLIMSILFGFVMIAELFRPSNKLHHYLLYSTLSILDLLFIIVLITRLYNFYISN